MDGMTRAVEVSMLTILDSAKFLERIWPSTPVNGGDGFGAAMWWDL